MRPAWAADAEASVRTIRAGHLSDVTVNVVEQEAGAMEGVRVARAWVFHDDIFIFISEDHCLYTSVEVKYSFIFVSEADLEVLMLFVRLFVSSNVENDGMMG